MKLYLAGSWLRRDEIRKYADELKSIGIEITSRWLYSHGECTSLEEEYSDALEDLDDIRKADALILFTSGPAGGYQTGGRHFETGYAWAKGLDLFIVGPRENIFHNLVSNFNVSENWEDFKYTHLFGQLVDATR